MGYIGMCGPKGYGFSAVLVINRVSILHCRLDIFKKKLLFHHHLKDNQQRPFTHYVYSNLEKSYNTRLKQVMNRALNFCSGHK